VWTVSAADLNKVYGIYSGCFRKHDATEDWAMEWFSITSKVGVIAAQLKRKYGSIDINSKFCISVAAGWLVQSLWSGDLCAMSEKQKRIMALLCCEMQFSGSNDRHGAV
jgi:hypothetical protein